MRYSKAEQMYNGERRNIFTKRDKTKMKILKLRKQINLSKTINYNLLTLNHWNLSLDFLTKWSH